MARRRSRGLTVKLVNEIRRRGHADPFFNARAAARYLRSRYRVRVSDRAVQSAMRGTSWKEADVPPVEFDGRNRWLWGRQSPNASGINDEKVLIVWQWKDSGIGAWRVGELLRVPPDIVKSIWDGRTWRWLTHGPDSEPAHDRRTMEPRRGT